MRAARKDGLPGCIYAVPTGSSCRISGRYCKGSASNLARVLLSMLVSLVLPPFLVHRMSAAEYSAWVLILQLSAYVGLLDFGLQTAIGKFVAEHEAGGDNEANHHLVSTSFTILTAASLIAAVAMIVAAQHIPALFDQMPAALVPQVRWGVLAVGLSAAFALPFGSFFCHIHRAAALRLSHRESPSPPAFFRPRP